MAIQPSNEGMKASFEAHLAAKCWQNETFKQELIGNPKEVIEKESRAFSSNGNSINIPEGVTVTVLEQSASQQYLVLPAKPSLTESEELSEEALEAIAGGWFCLLFGWG